MYCICLPILDKSSCVLALLCKKFPLTSPVALNLIGAWVYNQNRTRTHIITKYSNRAVMQWTIDGRKMYGIAQ